MSIITLSAICLIPLTVLFVWMGIYSNKLNQSSDDFLMAGRKAPFWLLSAAYTGGAIGGAAVTGMTGYGFVGGMSNVWPYILPAMGSAVFILLFARRLNYFGQTYKAVTVTDFLCKRYGESIRLPVAIIAFFRPGFILGMQFIAIAVVLRVAFGWPMWVGVIVTAVVMISSLIAAGQHSALLTEWFQTIIKCATIILFSIVCFKLAGGMTSTVDLFYTVLPEQYINAFKTDFSIFTVYILTLGVFYLVDPWVYMWCYVAKSPKIGQNAQLSTLGMQLFGFLVLLSGMAVAVAVKTGALVLPKGLSPDAIYSYLALNSSVSVGSFLIVGLLMVIISSGSSYAMNGVQILTNDIYHKCINKNATPKQLVLVGRLSLFIVALVGIGGALWLPSLIPLWTLAQAIVLSGLCMVVLCAWFWKRSTTAGAFWSTILGGAAAMGWALYAWTKVGSPGALINGFHAVHVGLLVSIPVMIIVSLATKPEYERAEVTNYKTLGDEMKAYNAKQGEVETKGVWGYLGATTAAKKAAWYLVFVLGLMHFIIILCFPNIKIGHISLWLSLLVSVGMLLIYIFLGGSDVIKMFSRPTKKVDHGLNQCNQEAK